MTQFIHSLRHRQSRGFTLIELLVVIAIIGILATIVLASLSTARVKSRDARRVADISQLRSALELYFDGAGSYVVGTQEALSAALAPSYIAGIPVAPLPGIYTYQSLDGASAACSASPCVSYVLQAVLEEATNQAFKSDVDGTVGGVNCADNQGVSPDTNRFYCVRP